MASSHRQAYLSASEVTAASPSLDVASLALPDPGGDALLVTEIDGLGRVAARTAGEFTHVVTNVDRCGVELWDAPFWRVDGDAIEDLAELPAGPLDLARALALLADAPPGVREAVVDAARAGPVTLVEPDPARRAAWIAWITALLPEPPTFTTFAAHPLDLRVCATTPEHADAFRGAIDTARAAETEPSQFAKVATAVAQRDPSALAATDAVTLAVHGGATDLLAPEDLPRALELITELVKRGDVSAAARAAAGLGRIGTAIVLAQPPAQQLDVLPEPDPEPVDAEVVEATAIEVDEVVAWTPPVVEPEPAVAPPEVVMPVTHEHTFGEGLPLRELEPQGERPLEDLMAVFTSDPLEAPEEDEVLEEAEVGMSLEEFEASLKRERDS